MLLTIALACFALQVIAWLVLPSGGQAGAEVGSELISTDVPIESTDAFAA